MLISQTWMQIGKNIKVINCTIRIHLQHSKYSTAQLVIVAYSD